MRVLHVTPYFAPAFSYGGPPRSILGLCRGLQRVGINVQVVATTANGVSELRASPAGGDHYEGVAVRYFPLTFPRRMFSASGLATALAAEIRRSDVVHIHGLWNLPGWTAAWLARRIRTPYVISPRGMLDPWSMAYRARRKRIAYWMVERRNLAGAAFLHATSTSEANALERYSVNRSIVTVSNGVEVPLSGPSAPGEFRSRLGLSAKEMVIVFLGRIHVKKRLDLLADAFTEVCARRGGAHLVVAGPDEGGHRREVEPRFASVGERVHWTGELDENAKWALLAEANALVMCSATENFGMSVVEALAAGVPVVVTQTCPWEEIEPAGCGFWVPPTAEAIAAALLHLGDDPAMAKEMGRRGRALAERRYAWESIAYAMGEYYRAALRVQQHRRGE